MFDVSGEGSVCSYLLSSQLREQNIAVVTVSGFYFEYPDEMQRINVPQCL